MSKTSRIYTPNTKDRKSSATQGNPRRSSLSPSISTLKDSDLDSVASSISRSPSKSSFVNLKKIEARVDGGERFSTILSAKLKSKDFEIDDENTGDRAKQIIRILEKNLKNSLSNEESLFNDFIKWIKDNYAGNNPKIEDAYSFMNMAVEVHLNTSSASKNADRLAIVFNEETNLEKINSGLSTKLLQKNEDLTQQSFKEAGREVSTLRYSQGKNYGISLNGYLLEDYIVRGVWEENSNLLKQNLSSLRHKTLSLFLEEISSVNADDKVNIDLGSLGRKISQEDTEEIVRNIRDFDREKFIAFLRSIPNSGRISVTTKSKLEEVVVNHLKTVGTDANTRIENKKTLFSILDSLNKDLIQREETSQINKIKSKWQYYPALTNIIDKIEQYDITRIAKKYLYHNAVYLLDIYLEKISESVVTAANSNSYKQNDLGSKEVNKNLVDRLANEAKRVAQQKPIIEEAQLNSVFRRVSTLLAIENRQISRFKTLTYAEKEPSIDPHDSILLTKEQSVRLLKEYNKNYVYELLNLIPESSREKVTNEINNQKSPNVDKISSILIDSGCEITDQIREHFSRRSTQLMLSFQQNNVFAQFEEMLEELCFSNYHGIDSKKLNISPFSRSKSIVSLDTGKGKTFLVEGIITKYQNLIKEFDKIDSHNFVVGYIAFNNIARIASIVSDSSHTIPTDFRNKISKYNLTSFNSFISQINSSKDLEELYKIFVTDIPPHLVEQIENVRPSNRFLPGTIITSLLQKGNSVFNQEAIDKITKGQQQIEEDYHRLYKQFKLYKKGFEIVNINLANKDELKKYTSNENLFGKVIIIDEDLFIEDSKEDIRKLVNKGAKIIRVGATTNYLKTIDDQYRVAEKDEIITELNELRNNQTLLAKANHDFECDDKDNQLRNLSNSIDQFDVLKIEKEEIINESRKKIIELQSRTGYETKEDSSQNDVAIEEEIRRAELELKKKIDYFDRTKKIEAANTRFSELYERRRVTLDKIESSSLQKQDFKNKPLSELISIKSGVKKQQNILPGRSFNFDSDQSQIDEIYQKLQEPAIVIVNFIKDNTHYCALKRGSDTIIQFASSEINAHLSNIDKNSNVVMIYAGSYEFVVGGDFGELSVLDENDEQNFFISNAEDLNVDLFKQMIGRDRGKSNQKVTKNIILEESLGVELSALHNLIFQTSLRKDYQSSKADLFNKIQNLFIQQESKNQITSKINDILQIPLEERLAILRGDKLLYPSADATQVDIKNLEFVEDENSKVIGDDFEVYETDLGEISVKYNGNFNYNRSIQYGSVEGEYLEDKSRRRKINRDIRLIILYDLLDKGSQNINSIFEEVLNNLDSYKILGDNGEVLSHEDKLRLKSRVNNFDQDNILSDKSILNDLIRLAHCQKSALALKIEKINKLAQEKKQSFQEEKRQRKLSQEIDQIAQELSLIDNQLLFIPSKIGEKRSKIEAIYELISHIKDTSKRANLREGQKLEINQEITLLLSESKSILEEIRDNVDLTKISNLRKEIEDKDTIILGLQDQYKELGDSSSKEKEQLLEEIKRTEEEREKLKLEKTEAEREFELEKAGSEESLLKLQSQIAELETKLADYESKSVELSQLKDGLREGDEKIKSYEESIDFYKKRIEELNQGQESLKNNNDKQKQRLEENINSLTVAIEKIKQKRKDKAAKIEAEVALIVSEFEQKLNLVESEKLNLSQRLKDLELSLSEINNELLDSEKKKSELETTLDQLHLELNKLKANKEAESASNNIHKNELEKNISELKTKITQKNDELEKVKAENYGLEKAIEELEKEKDKFAQNLDARLYDKDQQILNLKTRLEEYQIHIQEMTNTLDSSFKFQHELSQGLEDLEGKALENIEDLTNEQNSSVEFGSNLSRNLEKLENQALELVENVTILTKRKEEVEKALLDERNSFEIINQNKEKDFKEQLLEIEAKLALAEVEKRQLETQLDEFKKEQDRISQKKEEEFRDIEKKLQQEIEAQNLEKERKSMVVADLESVRREENSTFLEEKSRLQNYLDSVESELENIRNQKSSSDAENQSLKQTISDLNNLLESSSEAQLKLKQQIDNSNADLEKLRQEKLESDSSQESLSGQIQDLNSQLESSSQQSRKEKEFLEQQLSQKSKEYAELKEKSNDLQTEISDRETKIADLKREFDNEKSEAEKAQAELKAQISVLNDKSNNLEQEKAEAIAKIQQLLAEKEENQAEINRLNEQLEDSGSKNGQEQQKLRNELQNLIDVNWGLEEGLRQEQEKLQKVSSDKESKIEELNNSKDFLARRLVEQQESLENQMMAGEDFYARSYLRELKNQEALSEFQANLEKLQAEIQIKDNFILRVEEEKAGLESRVNEALERLEVNESQLSASSTRIEGLQGELTQSSQELEIIRAELREENEKFKQEKNSLTAQNHQLSQENAQRLEAQKKELEAKKSVIESQLEEERQKNQDLLSQQDAINQTVEALNVQIKQQNESISDLKAQNEEERSQYNLDLQSLTDANAELQNLKTHLEEANVSLSGDLKAIKEEKERLLREKSDLESKLTSSIEEKTTLQTALEKLRESVGEDNQVKDTALAQKSDEIKAKETEISQLLTQIKENEAALSSNDKENADLQSEIESLNSAKLQVETRNTELASQLEKLNLEKEQLAGQATELKNRITALEEERTESEHNFEQQKKLLQEHTSIKDRQNQQEAANQEQVISDLIKKLSSLEESLEETNSRKAELEGGLSQVMSELQSQKEENEKLSKRVVNFENLEKRAQETISDNEKKILELRSSLENLKSSSQENIDIFNGRIKYLLDENNNLTRLQEGSQRSKQDLESQLSSVRSQQRESESRVNALALAISEEKRKQEALEARLAEELLLRGKVEVRNAELQTQLDKFSSLQSEFDEARGDLSEYEERIKHLESSIIGANSRSEQAKQEFSGSLTKLKVEKNSLEQAVLKLKEEKDEFVSKISQTLSALQQSIVGKESENKSLRESLERRGEEKGELERSQASLKELNLRLVKQVDDLRTQMSSLEQEKNSKISSNEDLLQQLSSLSGELLSIKDQYSFQLSRNEEIERSNKEAIAEKERYLLENSDLLTRLASLQEELANTRSDLENNKRALAQLQTPEDTEATSSTPSPITSDGTTSPEAVSSDNSRIKDLEAQNEALQSLKIRLEQEISDIRTTLDKSLRTISALQEENAQKQQEEDGLKQEKEKLENSKKQLSMEKAALSAKLAANKLALEELAKAKEDERKRLKDTNKELSKEKIRLQRELELNSNTLTKLREQQSELIAEIERLGSDRANMVERLSTADRRLQDSESQNEEQRQELLEQNSAITAELKRLEEERQTITKELLAAQTQINNAEARAEYLEKENQELFNSKSHLEELEVILRRRQEDLEKENAETNQKNQNLGEQMGRLEKEKTELEAGINSLSQQLKKLLAEREDSGDRLKEISQLEKIISQQQKRSEQLSNEMESLKDQQREEREKRDHLLSLLGSLEENNDELRSQLVRRLQSEKENRDEEQQEESAKIESLINRLKRQEQENEKLRAELEAKEKTDEESARTDTEVTPPSTPSSEVEETTIGKESKILKLPAEITKNSLRNFFKQVKEKSGSNSIVDLMNLSKESLDRLRRKDNKNKIKGILRELKEEGDPDIKKMASLLHDFCDHSKFIVSGKEILGNDEKFEVNAKSFIFKEDSEIANDEHKHEDRHYYSEFSNIRFIESANDGDKKNKPKIFKDANLFMANFRNCSFDNIDFSEMDMGIFCTINFKNCEFTNCKFNPALKDYLQVHANSTPSSEPRATFRGKQILGEEKVEIKGNVMGGSITDIDLKSQINNLRQSLKRSR